MKNWVFGLAGVLASVNCSVTWATDLSMINRSMRKEPAYQTKTQHYCLLVFGPEANTRVWLVLDSNMLYVDRNSNGDLTEEGELVKVSDTRFRKRGPIAVWHRFEAGEIAESARKQNHTHLMIDYHVPNSKLVAETPEEKHLKAALEANPGHAFINISIRLRGRIVQSAAPMAADQPKIAPIVHFDGPLTFACNPDPQDPPPFFVEMDGKLCAAAVIGTPGMGKNAFAPICFDDVPEDVHPVAEIKFPVKEPGAAPIRTRLLLTRRCCGNVFYHPVRVPDEVGEGKAKITLAIPILKKLRVAPATFETPVVRVVQMELSEESL